MKTNTYNNSFNNQMNVCNNCFKVGHQIYFCKLPIQSYGIIVFRNSPRGIEYLMIRRKDSFSYIDLIRGKYSPNNIEQIQNIIDDITLEEKERLLNENYEYLRNFLWLTNISPIHYKNEDLNAYKKFEIIKEFNLESIINNSKTTFIDQEWEFPKGRKNVNEKDLDCAFREFEEETGYSKDDIQIINNIIPYEEIFIGSNYKSYKHRYFVGFMNEYNNNHIENFSKIEISKVEWKTYDECLVSIRPNSIEKKKIISNVNNLITNYKICNIKFN
jgi:ADP-ribose pyrophosphatase YjhB (NUDIX family)